MLNNFIYAKKKSLFTKELEAGNVLDEAIVFIEDTKEIWNHGTYFDGKSVDLSNIEESIQNIINNKADKSEVPTKVSDLTNDSGFITINDVPTGSLLKTYTFLGNNQNYLKYTITQEELEKIQNADIFYLSYESDKIQLTLKHDSDCINFSGYNLNNYPDSIRIFSVTINGSYVLMIYDDIRISDYISDYIGETQASYIVAMCEEIVDGASIEIVENQEELSNIAKSICMMLVDSYNNLVYLIGPYAHITTDRVNLFKFIGEYNNLTIECVLDYDTMLHYGTLHIKPKSEVDLSDYYNKSEIDTKVNNKQDAITDLETIRQGAVKGATALQSIPSEYVTETELSNKGYATTSALNNKVDIINGKLLSTEDFTTALKTKLEGLNNYDDTELSNAIETLRGDFDNIVSGDTTTAIKTFNEIIAFLDGLTDTQDLESIIASIEQQIAGKADNDSVVHIAGAETITGVKTFNGRVNFLGSGDSNAMYLSTNTRLNVDGTTNTVLGFSSDTFLINNAAYNLTLRGKGTRPTYNSTTLALSSDVNGKQEKLVSGTNIKTINGQSLLGSGNITISGGNSSSGGNGAYAEVNHGTSDTTFTLTPNTFHVWDEVGELTLTLGEETSGVANEYLFQFTSGSEPTVLTLPSGIVWANDDVPTIESNHIYQISILKGLASIMSFRKATLEEFSITIYDFLGWNGTIETYSYMSGMTWGEWCQSEYNTNGYYEVSGDIIFYNNPGITTMDGYVSYSTGYSTEYCTVDEIVGVRESYKVE